jgi:hypothetical protein
MNAAGGLVIEVDGGEFDIGENAFDEVANTLDGQVVVHELLPKASFRKNVRKSREETGYSQDVTRAGCCLLSVRLPMRKRLHPQLCCQTAPKGSSFDKQVEKTETRKIQLQQAVV